MKEKKKAKNMKKGNHEELYIALLPRSGRIERSALYVCLKLNDNK